VDDRWAMVGSANLDGVSLHSYGDDFSGALGRRVFRGVRNFDVSVLVQAGPDPDDPTAACVRTLRQRLWREHLGRGPARPRTPASRGGLRSWNATAARNVSALGDSSASGIDGRSFILPYSTCATPAAQLVDVGVVLAPSTLELCFEPSWLQVHLSPNWVRNMFG
jgi:hypothetical protein